MGWYEDVRVSQPSVSPARLGDGNVNLAALAQAEASLSDSKFNSIDRGIKQLQNLFTEPNIASRKRDDELFAMSERFGDTLNKQSEIARKNEERQASDLYYNELAKGVQEKGGLYGDLITKESNKYDLTPEEVGLSTQYKNDPLLARAAGQNSLADKLAWQLNAGDKADSFVASNLGDESRTEMYDRINSLVAKQGLAIPKEGIVSADQARLAEQKSIEDKAKLLDERKAEIGKSETANLWKYIGTKGTGSTVTDDNGNEIQVGTTASSGAQSRLNNSFNKDVDSGLVKITDAIIKNTKGSEDTSKGVVGEQATKLYNQLIKDGVSPDVASANVVSGIGSKDPAWGAFWSDKKATFTKDQIGQLLPTIKETMDLKRGTDIVGKVKINEKEESAANLINLLSQRDKVELSKINEDRAKLLLTPDERRNARATQWLEREGIIGKSSSEPVVGSANAIDMSKYKDFNMDRYINKAINIESSGNSKAQSPGSGSYYGLGQLSKESVEGMGISWNDYKNNPDTQVSALKNFTAKNVKDLESNGLPVNDFTVYVAHNQGVNGAKQILSGETPSKQVMLNMLNQGIDNNLPKIPQGKAGAGQIDINAVMADKSITADYLNKEYAPVDNYLRKFSKKFDTEIDKVITPGSTKLELKGQGNEGYGITPNRLDKNKENASAYMSMTPEQRTELANSFNEKSGKNVEEVDALRKKLLSEERTGSSDIIKNIVSKTGPKEFSKDFVYESIGVDKDPYAKTVADRYLENNGGFIDSRTDIEKIMKEKGLNRLDASKYYQDITGVIKPYIDYTKDFLKKDTGY